MSSGDYYLKSLNVLSSSYLYLNVTNAPIRVFVQGNINFDGYLTAYLNGQSSGTSSLASLVLFQTGGNFNLAGLDLYEFYGTVFAPSGSVSLSVGQMDGSIMSSGSVSATTYLTKAQYSYWPVLSLATSNAKVITGGTANLGVSLTNIASSTVNYALAATVSGNLAGIQSFSQSGTLPAQATQNLIPMPTTSTNIGVNSLTVSASAGAFIPIQTATASLTVLDHAAAAFADGSTVLNLDFGSLQVGSGTQSLQFQIENLPAQYRAGLDLDSVTALSDPGGVFTTDATPFSDLPAGTMSVSVRDCHPPVPRQGRVSGCSVEWDRRSAPPFSHLGVGT